MISQRRLFRKHNWKPSPERFEAGTPNFADAIGLGAACDYLDALGRPKSRPTTATLARLAYEKLSRASRTSACSVRRATRRSGQFCASAMCTRTTS